MREISRAEGRICTHLHPILASLPVLSSVQESEGFAEVLLALEWFIPEVLREIHVEWKGESLDGIFPVVARKTGDREIEIIGLCCLISDQTLTPLHLRLQLACCGGSISWLECRLGENTDDGMLRAPYTSDTGWGIAHVLNRLDSIDWTYRVGYGDREDSPAPPAR
ncbi:MAG: hypothetical protein ACLQNE_07950 [Thermoguttaceae bacterium]